jgi:hypothetical protein
MLEINTCWPEFSKIIAYFFVANFSLHLSHSQYLLLIALVTSLEHFFS